MRCNMIRAAHLLRYAIKPTLSYLEMDSPAARALLMGTAAQESWLGHFLVQMGGPALGIYQMEPDTHDDIWRNWLFFRRILCNRLRDMTSDRARLNPRWPPPETMITDLKYATAMARLHYRRVPEPLPEWHDVRGLARYWKKHYNTAKGTGTEEEFIRNYNERVLSKISDFK